MKYIKFLKDFIFEKKFKVEDNPNNNYLGIIIYEDKSFGITEKFIILYDFKNSDIIGFTKLSNVNSKKSFTVLRSYAIKGYGPLIYDFSIMSVNPLPLTPSKYSIKPAAMNVWRYYYEMRPDVNKKRMSKSDELYQKFYYENQENTSKNDKIIDDNLVYLNCYYSLSPSNEFLKLKEAGDLLSKEYNLNPKKIADICEDIFDKEYHK